MSILSCLPRKTSCCFLVFSKSDDDDPAPVHSPLLYLLVFPSSIFQVKWFVSSFISALLTYSSVGVQSISRLTFVRTSTLRAKAQTKAKAKGKERHRQRPRQRERQRIWQAPAVLNEGLRMPELATFAALNMSVKLQSTFLQTRRPSRCTVFPGRPSLAVP